MKKTSFSVMDKCLKPLLKKGVEKGVFSGAALGIYTYRKQKEERIIFCHGSITKDSLSLPVNKATFFDLASLTKPLCTVLSILHLIENETLKWDTDTTALFGKEKAKHLKNVQIRHLMSHSSGLKAYEPFYQHFEPILEKENKKRVLEYIFREKKVYKTGDKFMYSDLGYILLGEIIERISGQPLDKFFREKICQPLGLEKNILFLPIDTNEKQKTKNIAATQFCPWRKRILQGEVDDEHSWLMNGVSGHAGVFGTIDGVLDMNTHLLNQWHERSRHPSYSNTLLQRAMSRQNKNSTWCLGFDSPSPQGSSCGRYFSRQSVGHLGFTGTSFWIDLKKEVVVVLLTNRVHPTRDNEKIKAFRPLLHNAVFEALEKE